MTAANIFLDHAPAYWAKGLPAIPLYPRDKRPIPKAWQVFHESMPTPEAQACWLNTVPNANIGMVMGQQSGIVALDIDTTDPKIQKVIEDCLPTSPWRRIGKKGAVLGFKFNGHKTFRIKDLSGKTLVEVLSSRTQIVIPPSIHPDTGQPYHANTDLLAVHDQLPVLPREVETILREALKANGIELSHSGWTKITETISVGARDNQMVSMAGLFAHGVTRGELTLVEALARMHVWCENFVEKVAGDDIDPEKGKQRIIQFLVRDVLGERKRNLPVGWDEGLTDEDKKTLGLDVFGVEEQQWSFDQIKAYVIAEFEKHGPDTPARANAIQYALARLARSEGIDSLDEERLVKWMADSSALKLTVRAIKGKLKDLRRGDVQGEDHTEIAQAVIRDFEEYGLLRFQGDHLWQWKGSDWQRLDRGAILRHIAEEYGKLNAARKSADHTGIYKIICSLVPSKQKQMQLAGINFANGFLTERLRLVEHNPEFGATYTLPYCYRPELSGKAFRFMELLYRCWGEDKDCEDKIKALQEAYAATVFGIASRYQRAICLHGVPFSGKSVIYKVLKGLMPEGCVSTVPPHEFGDKFAKTQMFEKLLNIAGELSESKAIDGDSFKLIVEGAEINGQYKGRDIFVFRPLCAQWFTTNHLPKTRDTSAGFNRRWLFLDFEKPLHDGEQEPNYEDIVVAEEREAIMAWAVEGLQRLLDNRDYTLPKSHHTCFKQMANDNNSVRFFLTASGRVQVGPSPLAVIGPDGSRTSPRVSESELHDAYYGFCSSLVGGKPDGLPIFRKKMKELERELGFKMHCSTIGQGVEVFEYENITLVTTSKRRNTG